jgi:hypothetical protein
MRRPFWSLYLFCFLGISKLLIVDLSLAQAIEGVQPGVESKKDAWNFSISGIRHQLKGGDGNEIIGNGFLSSFGRSYITDNWFLIGSFDLILGPYERARKGQLDVEFEGTGASLLFGHNAEALNLRSPEGVHGFTIGVQYLDMTGRSYGKNLKQVREPYYIENEGLIDNYKLRVSNLSIMPAIFFAWFEGARPNGTAKKLLMTRVEAHMITVGFSVPIYATYKAKYLGKVRTPEIGAGELIDEPRKDSGKLEGFSLIVSYTTLFGI